MQCHCSRSRLTEEVVRVLTADRDRAVDTENLFVISLFLTNVLSITKGKIDAAKYSLL